LNMRNRLDQDRVQLIIFAAVCVVLIAIGFAWALWGDAASVIPVPTATPEATPTLP
jgi:small-conductance mechanosensitive channel